MTNFEYYVKPLLEGFNVNGVDFKKSPTICTDIIKPFILEPQNYECNSFSCLICYYMFSKWCDQECKDITVNNKVVKDSFGHSLNPGDIVAVWNNNSYAVDKRKRIRRFLSMDANHALYSVVSIDSNWKEIISDLEYFKSLSTKWDQCQKISSYPE